VPLIPLVTPVANGDRRRRERSSEHRRSQERSRGIFGSRVLFLLAIFHMVSYRHSTHIRPQATGPLDPHVIHNRM
jgi:hypothetical protein